MVMYVLNRSYSNLFNNVCHFLYYIYLSSSMRYLYTCRTLCVLYIQNALQFEAEYTQLVDSASIVPRGLLIQKYV